MTPPPRPTPDDLDRAFSQYFRAQLPARWPAPPIPVQAAAAPARDGPWRTRLTLAASVAAVLALGFAVSYGPGVAPPNKPSGVDPSSVVGEGKALQKHLQDVPPMDMLP